MSTKVIKVIVSAQLEVHQINVVAEAMARLGVKLVVSPLANLPLLNKPDPDPPSPQSNGRGVPKPRKERTGRVVLYDYLKDGNKHSPSEIIELFIRNGHAAASAPARITNGVAEGWIIRNPDGSIQLSTREVEDIGRKGQVKWKRR